MSELSSRDRTLRASGLPVLRCQAVGAIDQVNYRDAGPASAEVVILLHGLGSHSAGWRGVIAGARILVSRAGLGRSRLWRQHRASKRISSGRGLCRSSRGYETRDGKFISVGAIEAKFYALLLEKLGLDPASLPGQLEREHWPALRARFAERFRTRTRDEWCALMEGTDICFAPVLSFREAPQHPQNVARGSFVEIDGIVQPAPAPRFSRTPGSVKGGPPQFGAQTEEALLAWGFTPAEIEALRNEQAIGRL